MKLIKMSQVFSDWLNGHGIFDYLNTFDVPWSKDTQDVLNIEYHGVRCEKYISPLLSRLLDSDSVLTPERASIISKIIVNKYLNSWNKQYEALFSVYNPIENYNRMETETVTNKYDSQNTRTNTGNDTITNTGSDTTTNTGTDSSSTNGTQTSKRTGTDTTINKVYGFNNNIPTPQSQIVNTPETTDTLTYDGLNVNHQLGSESSNSYNREQKTDYNTQNTDNHTGTDTITKNNNTHGNIGVTTTQDMIKSEVELRKTLFFNIVYNDIDTILTLSIL